MIVAKFPENCFVNAKETMPLSSVLGAVWGVKAKKYFPAFRPMPLNLSKS